ncbi:HP1 family phage holin [Escherichia coli]|uniref:HP1 family phage holin n=1 Tax=Escherichia coli TaxID=562 RepID=UPI0028DE92E1|nr:diacylglyceryl transferase [Escherichia coli]
MGKLWKRFIESLSPKKLGVLLALVMGFTLGAIKFWDWFKYRVGIITTALAVLSINEWAVIIGILCTVVTCLVNWYYERKKYLIALGGGVCGE